MKQSQLCVVLIIHVTIPITVVLIIHVTIPITVVLIIHVTIPITVVLIIHVTIPITVVLIIQVTIPITVVLILHVTIPITVVLIIQVTIPIMLYLFWTWKQPSQVDFWIPTKMAIIVLLTETIPITCCTYYTRYQSQLLLYLLYMDFSTIHKNCCIIYHM